MERRSIQYSGRVQGVGFRQTTVSISAGFSVGGYVKNLPDGRVELVVEGSAEEIDGMVAAVETRLGRWISSHSVHTQPISRADAVLGGSFEIRYD